MTRVWVGLLVVLAGCDAAPGRNTADSLPQLIGGVVPFGYPADLYAQGIQGDVTLRLHVDSTGGVVPESIWVVQSSGHRLLDSTALEGAPALQFRPAQLGGRAVPLTVLFPVKFRVPVGTRTPADTGGAVPDR